MANANEEVVRSYIAAFSADDLDAVRERLADDVVFHLGETSQLSGDYRGPDEVLAMFRKITHLLGAPLQPEVHDILSSDEHVVALSRRTLAGVQADAAVVYHVANGKITEAWVHEARQAELDAALGSASS